MRKLQYIQPEVRIDGINSKDSIMQLVLGSPTAIEPGKTNILKRKDGTRAVF